MTDELLNERYALAIERIRQIPAEKSVPQPYRDFFAQMAQYLCKMDQIRSRIAEGYLKTASEEELAVFNREPYEDVIGEWYETSYGNPAFAVRALGEMHGRSLCCLYRELGNAVVWVYEDRLLELTAAMELYLELYAMFEEETLPSAQYVKESIYWYVSDYAEERQECQVREIVDPSLHFVKDIVMESDLTDLRYLYQYGEYITENEKGTARCLNTFSQEEIDAMARTYTEGFRKCFLVARKDLSKKKTVSIRFHIGFERMIRAAILQFREMGLEPVISRGARRTWVAGASANKQYDYDHREDRAYYLDKAYVERGLETWKNAFEEEKVHANGMAGPAVIEVFGEEPFSPETKKEAFRYSEKQQQLCVYEMSQRGQITNQYIKGEERSFTIIAYPLPSIGARFEEIFAETVKINTLDYMLYRNMQQKMIDVLDQADRVHITGKGANKTDLYVNIWKLQNPEGETAFENCVADVNIPVGEVFTSPVLEGTNGKLHVGQVYLNGLNYKNLEIDFKDGMVEKYTCTNFEDETENKNYIRDNVLMHHETLPMGEFAIGTNTTAYRMARDYDIADKLPILIAEKTGPHFAVGDTCYSHEEDNLSYNPDGKAIVARENTVSAQRRENPEKAYLNCHTDITIPYDELDKITVIRKDGTTEDIIVDGRFVLAGTEALNEPLDR